MYTAHGLLYFVVFKRRLFLIHILYDISMALRKLNQFAIDSEINPDNMVQISHDWRKWIIKRE